MGLFNAGAKKDPARKERLIRIQRNIEASFRFEEDAMSRPLNPSTLKRLYSMDSLWILDRSGIKKLGSANYSRELRLFMDMKSKYGNVDSIMVQSGGQRYYVVEKDNRVYAFSTPFEMSNSELALMLGEIDASLAPQKIFLSSDTNITEQ